MLTPRIKQHCWYCGNELITMSSEETNNWHGVYWQGSQQYPSFVLRCNNHSPYIVLFHAVEMSLDCLMSLNEAEIIIKPGVWACVWLAYDKPYWTAGNNNYEMTNDMLQMSPEQLGNKIKKLLPFI